MNNTNKNTISFKKTNNNPATAQAYSVPCWLSQVSVSLISVQAKLVYCRLIQWSNEEGHAHRSASQLAEELGMNKRSIERHLKELRNLKLIGTFQREAGGVNYFEFYEHEWMRSEIKEQLLYKNKTKDNPPTNLSVPCDKLDTDPPTNLRNLNSNIKYNNNNNKYIYNIYNTAREGLSENVYETTVEVQNMDSNEKSDYFYDLPIMEEKSTQAIEIEPNSLKSDYCYNRYKECTVNPNYKIHDLINDNPHEIDRAAIEEWIEFRFRKNLPLTPRLWLRVNTVLAALKSHGISPHDAFERMLVNEWKGIEVYFFKAEIESKKSSKNTEIYDDDDFSWAPSDEEIEAFRKNKTMFSWEPRV